MHAWTSESVNPLHVFEIAKRRTQRKSQRACSSGSPCSHVTVRITTTAWTRKKTPPKCGRRYKIQTNKQAMVINTNIHEHSYYTFHKMVHIFILDAPLLLLKPKRCSQKSPYWAQLACTSVLHSFSYWGWKKPRNARHPPKRPSYAFQEFAYSKSHLRASSEKDMKWCPQDSKCLPRAHFLYRFQAIPFQ